MAHGEVVLDFLRNEMGLHGTKEGCREGDCGACTVLVGEPVAAGMLYKTAASCLLPLGSLHAKHLVTIEGLTAPAGLSIIQKALTDEGATQCGFCTPGIVVALTGFLLTSRNFSKEDAIAAIEGNICRCTGYISIRRAAQRLLEELNFNLDDNLTLRHRKLTEAGILPDIFRDIRQRLEQIPPRRDIPDGKAVTVAGGTDLFVQQADKLCTSELNFISRSDKTDAIYNNEDGAGVIDACATVEELRASELFSAAIPQWQNTLQLMSSTMIRNRATVAGNLVNASPIADLAIILLALNASLSIKSPDGTRSLPLDRFYSGYKQFDLHDDETIEKITVPPFDDSFCFNFEKVSRRQHLDIASVNSAAAFYSESGVIVRARISAGGVGPIPMLLEKTSEFLAGQKISRQTIISAMDIAMDEIAPIPDVRGSAAYKRRLLARLIAAHFIVCFPGHNLEDIIDELT
jgi:xanthine dehydrogenase small subunit